VSENSINNNSLVAFSLGELVPEENIHPLLLIVIDLSSDEVLAWLSVWSEVQMICVWFS